jgi:hypothetical protein
MHRMNHLLYSSLLAATLATANVQAEVAEDSSAAFKADNEAMGAAIGLAAPEATVTTHENGMLSATMGLSAMKMLVVRQNPDGSVSYGHAATPEDARAFTEGGHNHGLAEE